MTDSIITIATGAGLRDVRGEIIGDDVLAVHRTMHGDRDKGSAEWTLSHLPTGYAVIRGADRDALLKVGKALVKLAPLEVLELEDNDQVTARMPAELSAWLARCHRDGWTEPPEMNGACAPGGTKMASKTLTPEQATQKQQALAVKLGRGVMTRHVGMIGTEYRKAIRAAKKDGQPGDPAFMREQFKTDFLRDIVQVACAVAGIPVPNVQV